MHCPRCHQEAIEIRAFLTSTLGGVAYCKDCGWNTERATAKLRINMWANWAVAGIGVFLAAKVWRGPWGIRGALTIAVAFIAAPIGSGLLTRYRLFKIAVRQPGAPD